MANDISLPEALFQEFRKTITKKDFVKAQLKYPKNSEYKKVVIRPVVLKSGSKIQFSFFTRTQDLTSNHSADKLQQPLQEAFKTYPKSIYINLTSSAYQYTRKNGEIKFIKHQAKPSAIISEKHDRDKAYLIKPDNKDDADFLRKLGIIYLNNILPSEMKKYVQINRFLAIVETTVDKHKLTGEMLIVDFGCGSSELTFSLGYYFANKKKMKVKIIGVDRNSKLIRKNQKLAEKFNFDTKFISQKIEDFKLDQDITIAVSLHACDTATDDALHKALQHSAKFIFSSPCCHYNLHQRLKKSKKTPTAVEILTHDKIQKNRLIDMLTDSLRAQLLRINNYHTEIIEYVDKDHTEKNIMLKAIRKPTKNLSDARELYQHTKSVWGVTPYLEELLEKSKISK